MYAFIDRPVAAQTLTTRVMLGAVRGWIGAAARGQCHCCGVKQALDAIDAAGCAPHLLRALRCLYGHARLPLHFGAPDRSLITEDEAILLGAIELARSGRRNQLAEVCSRLVQPEAAVALDLSLRHIASALAGAKHALLPPAPGSPPPQATE